MMAKKAKKKTKGGGPFDEWVSVYFDDTTANYAVSLLVPGAPTSLNAPEQHWYRPDAEDAATKLRAALNRIAKKGRAR